MSRLSLRHIVLIALLMALPSAVFATTLTIDFESLSDGDGVTNQFPGVTFSNARVLTAGSSLNEFEFPPHSGSNVVFDDGGPISIGFNSPILSIGGYFTYLTPLMLTAFDANHIVLGSIASAFSSNSGDAGSSPNELLQFSSGLGISSVIFAGNPLGGSFTLDDVTLTSLPQTTAVQEPATLSLVLIGGAGILRRARRLRARCR